MSTLCPNTLAHVVRILRGRQEAEEVASQMWFDHGRNDLGSNAANRSDLLGALADQFDRQARGTGELIAAIPDAIGRALVAPATDSPKKEPTNV